MPRSLFLEGRAEAWQGRIKTGVFNVHSACHEPISVQLLETTYRSLLLTRLRDPGKQQSQHISMWQQLCCPLCPLDPLCMQLISRTLHQRSLSM